MWNNKFKQIGKWGGCKQITKLIVYALIIFEII